MAIVFNRATPDFLRFNLPSGNFMTAPPLTMSAWVLTSNVGLSTQAALWIGDSTNGARYASLEANTGSTGDPAMYLVNSPSTPTSITCNTANSITVNTWHHIAGRSVSQTDHKSVLDGNLAAAGTSTTDEGNFVQITNRISVGERGDSSPTNQFTGRIAEVAIWNVALSDQKIVELSLGYAPPVVQPDGLFFYAPLYRTGEYTDRMNGRVLVPSGTPATGTHPEKLRRWYYSSARPFTFALPTFGPNPEDLVGLGELASMHVLLQPRIGIRPS